MPAAPVPLRQKALAAPRLRSKYLATKLIQSILFNFHVALLIYLPGCEYDARCCGQPYPYAGQSSKRHEKELDGRRKGAG